MSKKQMRVKHFRIVQSMRVCQPNSATHPFLSSDECVHCLVVGLLTVVPAILTTVLVKHPSNQHDSFGSSLLVHVGGLVMLLRGSGVPDRLQ